MMKIEKVGSRSVVFTDKLGEWDLNMHLILGEKRNYVIDTGLGSECMIPVKEYLGNDQKPIVVVNTHHDWDHVWGNHCFKDDLIISHQLCRKLIAEQWSPMLEKGKEFIKGEVVQCLPNLVFGDGLYFPDDKIRLFYTPGHTIDGISVLDEVDHILNAGDNIGDTQDEIVPTIKTDVATYLTSVQQYQKLKIDACISGHNTILGKDVFDRIERLLQAT